VFPFRRVFYRRDRLGSVLEDVPWPTQGAEPTAPGCNSSPTSRHPLPRTLNTSSRFLCGSRLRSAFLSCCKAPSVGNQARRRLVPSDSAHPLYNCHVSLPFGARHELLWRADCLYDAILVVGHNDQPVVPGKGSAIFAPCHAPLGTPTQGCVAMKVEDLLCVLKEAQPGSCLVVKPS